jgi:ElaB/YqjD/DUF883 family membrane-anchored ribosome-binding protein
MTETDKKPLMVYPTPEQHEQWEEEANAKDMSKSGWVQAMVEAGRKKFDATVQPDESAQELRQQRNDLKEELDRARDRIAELENIVHQGEQQVISQYIHDNPGVTYSEIVQHVQNTVPERVNRHIEELEGDAVRVDDGEYYALGSSASENE